MPKKRNITPVKKFSQEEIEDYNSYIQNLIKNPKNWGKPSADDISVSQSYKGPCGDSIQFFLTIRDNTIEEARFITDGCGACMATANQTTLLIEGKSLDYADEITSEDIDKALKGLPEDHKHCTKLAKRTLARAIKKYKDKRGD